MVAQMQLSHVPEVGQQDALESRVRRLLEDVPDPEIPVLSVVELGIIRHIRALDAQSVEIGVSPTYTGCPATEVIHRSIREHLQALGVQARVVAVLSPPWSSDWLSTTARDKLNAYGIAPPAETVHSPKALLGRLSIACPRCASQNTQRVSEFGSTPCKALYRCKACLEPFEYFKCI
jgi:ring-1,2-phenylacetyl-CoA epoxidase subunit PaaD